MATYTINFGDGSALETYEGSLPKELRHKYLDGLNSHTIKVSSSTQDEFTISVEDNTCNANYSWSTGCTGEATLPIGGLAVGDTFTMTAMSTTTGYVFKWFDVDGTHYTTEDSEVSVSGTVYTLNFVTTNADHTIQAVFELQENVKTITTAFQKTKLTISQG